ncbi:MAG TPA: head-tail adaptor protein [Lachnospiraceae bacterium]|nr:head-tail adaptor protein [Lachnospiraceae bacterium]
MNCVDIGRLNKRITFLAYKDTVNEYGQDIQQLDKYKTVWASVEPTIGKEYMEAQRVRNELTYKIYTRYFTDLTVDMVINYKGRKFKIASLINYKENNELLQFVCTEMVGDKIE